MVPHKVKRNSGSFGEPDSEGVPPFQLMVSAGASLRVDEEEMEGTEDIHQEALMVFSIQVL